MTPLFVCLDLQRAFVRAGPLQAPHAGDALLHCRRFLAVARQKRWIVAHCFLRRPHDPLRLEGEDARPVEGFEPLINERVFFRERLSAYGHDAFERLMGEANSAGVVVAGLSASLTFIATAIDAFERNHRIIVAADALAGQLGREAGAHQHESVARDVALHLGFSSASAGEVPKRAILPSIP